MSDHITHIQESMAQAVAKYLDLDCSPRVPTELEASSAYISPNVERFLDAVADGATFQRPHVYHDVVIVGPAHDRFATQEWLQARMVKMARISGKRDVTVNGRKFPRFLRARIGIIDANKGLLGVTCEFMPIQMECDD